MCLHISKIETKKFAKKHKDDKKVRVFKVVAVKSYGCVSPCWHTEIKGGWYVSDRHKNDNKLTNWELRDRAINEGIHVFTSLSAAKRWSTAGEAVLECEAYMKDFIARGIGAQAVFMKIWIPAKEIRRVVKERI